MLRLMTIIALFSLCMVPASALANEMPDEVAESATTKEGVDWTQLAEVSPDEWPASAQKRESKILALVKEHKPGKYDELMLLRAEGGEHYISTLKQIAKRVKEAAWTPEQDAQRELRKGYKEQINALLEGYGELSPEEQSSRHKELVRIGGEVFEKKQAVRIERLEKLKERLAKLEDNIVQVADERDERINEWVDSRLSE